MGEGPLLSSCCSSGSPLISTGCFAEYEEFYEEEKDQRQGQLAEEEALGEGEGGAGRLLVVCSGLVVFA